MRSVGPILLQHQVINIVALASKNKECSPQYAVDIVEAFRNERNAHGLGWDSQISQSHLVDDLATYEEA